MSGAPLPFVSVIIPVLDDQDRLDACLDCFERLTYPRDAFEVIVVDNGSSPPVRVPVGGARLLFETRPGSYAARNTGIVAARGEVFAFTDADCLPTPDWLEGGVRRLLAEPGCGLVAGAVEVFCRDRDRPTAAELFELLTGFPQQRFVAQNGFGATANLFATRAAIDAVGGFDATLLTGGDVDLGERVRAAGYRLVYEPGARVRHPARRSIYNLLMKVVRTEVGMKHLAKMRGRRFPAKGRVPFALRLMAAPLAALARTPHLELRHRVATAGAMIAVEIVRDLSRRAFDHGLVPDVRRFWGK